MQTPKTSSWVNYPIIIQIFTIAWWNFFNHNARYWVPTILSICFSWICNPKSNLNLAFGNLITVTFNMTMAKDILISCTFPNVKNCTNGHWFLTFIFGIKSKTPTFTGTVAISNTKFAAVKDSQRGVVIFFVEKKPQFCQN